MKSFIYGCALAGLTISTAAFADPTVDGTRDAEYRTTAAVTYSPAAPNSNFGAPTPLSDASSYTISLFAGADSVYGFFQSDRPGVGAFANLYFDIDPSAMNGSDLGFEISSGRVNAFVPGLSGGALLDSSLYSVFASGNVVEFGLSNSLFTSPIAGLTYYNGQTFPGSGDPVTLRLSQSFGYSVAGGATYGPDRLGSVAIGGAGPGAVPEPATWAMMLLGFGMMGFGMRYSVRRSNAKFDLKVKRIAAGLEA